MKKNTVLILTHSLHVGGAEKHTYNLLTNSDKEKFKFVVICLFELGAIGKMLSDKGITIYHDIMKSNVDIIGFWKFIQIIRRERIDILYIILTPLTLFWGVMSAKLTGIKATITRSTTIYPIYHVTRKRRIITWLTLKFVDKIIAQSYSHREYLLEIARFNPEKIKVIYNGVCLENFNIQIDKSEIRKQLNIPPDSPLIGIVARLVPEKGISVLLKATRLIIDSVPGTHILIAGDGKEKNDLMEESKKLKIQSRVHFLGTREDIPRLLSLVDITVLSSVTEAFSNAILEYMAASKPVVATNAGSNAEVVDDGISGYIVPSNDPVAMAEALVKLLKNRSLANKMGEAGKKTVIEKFTLKKMIECYEKLFEASQE